MFIRYIVKYGLLIHTVRLTLIASLGIILVDVITTSVPHLPRELLGFLCVAVQKAGPPP
jgi:hypothetical protein